MIKVLFKSKVDGWNFYICNIFSKHIDLDVVHEDGKGFRSLIPFDEDKRLDWEARERQNNFKFPKEFKIAAQKFLNLKAFS